MARSDKKRKINTLEYVVIALLTVLLLVTFLLTESYEYNYGFGNLLLSPTTNPFPKSRAGDERLFDLKAIEDVQVPEIRIQIEPEFIASMNSALPLDVCSKVRYKKVPVKEVIIDGKVIPGKNWARYRGFCNTHWRTKQKSLKVSFGEDYKGYSEINLNAIETDKTLFEIWATRLLTKSDGIASRVGFAKLYINGEYDGVRFLVENLDSNLISSLNLDKGEIYREINWAYMGHAPGKYQTDINFMPYRDVGHLKEYWKKNARKKKPWGNFYDMQQSIYNSVITGDESWKKYINYNHYINYISVVTITGSDHLNNHNIPLYRPRKKNKYIPVGYDFGGSYANGVGDRLDSESKYGHSQPVIISQNWLGSLFWSDFETRKKIHGRIAQILHEMKPDLLYEEILSKAETVFGDDVRNDMYLVDFDSAEQWRSSLNNAEVIKRVEFLKKSYFDPSVAINKNWKESKRFQFLIDGSGIFTISLKHEAQSCSSSTKNTKVIIQVDGRDERTISRCINGALVLEDLVVEKNPFSSSEIKLSRSMPWRTSVGGILITVENPDSLSLEEIQIKSSVVRKKISQYSIWPFFLERVSDGVVNLGDLKESDAYSYELKNIMSEDKLSFQVNDNKLEIKNYRISSRINYDQYGPVLCWNDEKNTGCYEFDDKFLFYEEKRSEIYSDLVKYSGNVNFVDAEKVKDCKKFTFSRGVWTIVEPIIFGKDCVVQFMAGSSLEFSENSFMVVQGENYFPESKGVSFSGINGASWGGVIITGVSSAHVQYASFMNANEFMWNGNRYTGALNIIDVEESSVYFSVFDSNNGDDGLNVRGGKSRISKNVFTNNRDAIDLDLGTAVVQYNVISNNLDDGLDLGAAGPITIVRNIIQSSGDKGISIGERSTAKSYYNLMLNNNFGVAVKDGSAINIEGDMFVRNNISISAYTKTSDGSEENIIEGSASFSENEINLKVTRSSEEKNEEVEGFSFTELNISEIQSWALNNFVDSELCLNHIKDISKEVFFE